MTLRYMQGFESIRTASDLIIQGISNTVGLNAFTKPSTRMSGTRSLVLENSYSGSGDISPSYAGTSSFQMNTGLTINNLWQAGGFAFGAAAKLRDTSTQYYVGSVVPEASNVTTKNKMVWDGSKYWAIMRATTNAGGTAGTSTVIGTSTDLITWTILANQPTSASGYHYAIAYINNLIVVSCYQGAYAYLNPATDTTWSTGNMGVSSPAAVGTSNIVYINGMYYGITSGTSTYGQIKQSSTLNTTSWSYVGNYISENASTTTATLVVDTYGQNLFCFHTNTASTSTSRTTLQSYTWDQLGTSVAPTLNIAISGGANVGIVSLAISPTNGNKVAISNAGVIYYAVYGASSWTTIPAATSGIVANNSNSVAYDATNDRFVITGGSTATGFFVSYSTDGTGSAWTTTKLFSTSTGNALQATTLEFINSKLIGGGHQVTEFVFNPVNNTYGGTVKYKTQVLTASSSSGTAARASRLGVAAINSSGRQSYVGISGGGSGISGGSAPLYLSTENIVTSSTTMPNISIDATVPWHYFTFVFTATTTANTFDLQILVDGVPSSLTASGVALAGATDTTSTLYWTVPFRDFNVSILPTLVEFDDIYLLDNSGSVNNSPLPDAHIIAYRPTSDVQAQWTSSTSSNYGAVSGSSANTAVGAVSSSTAGAKDIYGTTNSFDISQYSVKAVMVDSVMKNTSLNSSTANVGILSNSVEVNSSDVTLSNGTLTYVSKIQETDPNTNSTWTKTAAQASQISITKKT